MSWNGLSSCWVRLYPKKHLLHGASSMLLDHGSQCSTRARVRQAGLHSAGRQADAGALKTQADKTGEHLKQPTLLLSPSKG